MSLSTLPNLRRADIPVCHHHSNRAQSNTQNVSTSVRSPPPEHAVWRAWHPGRCHGCHSCCSWWNRVQLHVFGPKLAANIASDDCGWQERCSRSQITTADEQHAWPTHEPGHQSRRATSSHDEPCRRSWVRAAVINGLGASHATSSVSRDDDRRRGISAVRQCQTVPSYSEASRRPPKTRRGSALDQQRSQAVLA